MNEVFLFVLIGLLAGLIPASVNAWKDPPYEGFSFSKFPRSLVTGGVLGWLMYYFQKYNYIQIDNLGYVFLSVYCLERLVGETIKACFLSRVHKEYQQFYKQYHLTFDTYRTRVIMGWIFFAVVSIGFAYSVQILHAYSSTIAHSHFWGALIGLLAGLIVATGGALKDSPSEGFEFDKFLRSPIVGLVGGWFLVGISSRMDLLLMACIGFDRVVLEGYKAYFSGKTRGMFDRMKVKYPLWKHERYVFFVTYIISVGFLILCLSIPYTATYSRFMP